MVDRGASTDGLILAPRVYIAAVEARRPRPEPVELDLEEADLVADGDFAALMRPPFIGAAVALALAARPALVRPSTLVMVLAVVAERVLAVVAALVPRVEADFGVAFVLRVVALLVPRVAVVLFPPVLAMDERVPLVLLAAPMVLPPERVDRVTVLRVALVALLPVEVFAVDFLEEAEAVVRAI